MASVVSLTRLWSSERYQARLPALLCSCSKPSARVCSRAKHLFEAGCLLVAGPRCSLSAISSMRPGSCPPSSMHTCPWCIRGSRSSNTRAAASNMRVFGHKQVCKESGHLYRRQKKWLLLTQIRDVWHQWLGPCKRLCSCHMKQWSIVQDMALHAQQGHALEKQQAQLG